MALKVAINGFGRIGRLVLRAIAESKRHDIQVVAINDLGSIETNAYLFNYDSVHGRYQGSTKITPTGIDIGMGEMRVFAEPNPENLPWSALNVDIVLECSGHFTSREKASKHLTAGAGRVLISSPADGVDFTVVYGVNHQGLQAEHHIVSNASCTTNCLAPVAFVAHNAIGIERGYMTTIHAYTGDQQLVDTSHKDMRRARAAALSMIPTSTGAARAVGLVLPDLKGKIDGTAIRVPVPNVSLVDFKFTTKRDTSVDEINEHMTQAAHGALQGIMSVIKEQLVSIDFNHSPYSSNFDLTQTQVIENRFCRVLSWYDNEWGFANRMTNTALAMSRLMA